MTYFHITVLVLLLILTIWALLDLKHHLDNNFMEGRKRRNKHSKKFDFKPK